MNLGIIGCGNLGASIAKGLISQAYTGKIYGSKRRFTEKDQMDGLHLTVDNAEVLKSCDLIIIALKPYNVLPFLKEFGAYIDPKRHTLISVATGVTIAEIRNEVPEVGIFRAMPNTAIAVQESLTALSFSEDRLGRKEQVREVFQSVGEVVMIDEGLMNSATVLGACGIAFVLRFMRAMIQGGIEVGFDAELAKTIVSQTVKGAAELIIQNNTHPEAEIDKVTTPKGCTITGLNEMEHSGFSSALIKGINASYQKID